MTIFDSCVMRLQTIGEYVKKIDDKTNKQLLPKYPQVPWVKVIGQRNIISHEYSAVDEEKIFITIKKHLPPLKSTVLLIIKDMKTRSHTDNFGENNVKCLIAKGIYRFVPHSSAGGF